MTKHQFFATAPMNMEPLLADELRRLGAQEVAQVRAGAGFSGTLESALRACLWSRVANRVLLTLSRFPAPDPQALYDGIRSIDWREHLDVDDTIAVSLSTSRSQITHSHYGALKVKDAIVDQFRERDGRRPTVQTERPDIHVNVYLLRDEATVSLDLSGESLHRRGYRQQATAAPMKENLAAAILLRAGWPDIAAAGGALLDPMCGSGTLPIEAAMIAADIAPGLLREYWGFTRWKQHDANAWNTLLDEARTRRDRGLSALPSIRGYDHDLSAVNIALANVERAGLHGHVHIEKRELEQCAPAGHAGTGLVVANPPYGERLGAGAGLDELYARLGHTLKENFPGWRAAVLTGNPELGKRLELRATRIHALYNGAIECKLLHFVITPEWFAQDPDRPRPIAADKRGGSAQMLANRLAKNRKRLGKWLRREGVSCYRLYDADLPEYALAIDIYENPEPETPPWIHVQEYAAPKSIDPRKARQRLREALGVIAEVLGTGQEQVFLKVRRPQKGTQQYEKLADTRRFHEVREGDCRLLVNFEDYLDTGLFLDHRITRKLLAELAGGKRFLNLFAYTGTGSVCAARGGAAATTTVDMSNTYLDWARRNMRLNGFVGDQHEFVQANCLEWLELAAGRDRYGLIFLDPPTFSTSARMQGTFDVQRDHATLINKTVELLEPGGLLVFSCNLRRFNLETAALPGLAVEDISRATLPRDFERNPKIHHCWKIRRQSGRR